MSKFKILVSLVIIMITGLAFASSDDIAERIKRVGDVCVQGVECSSGMAAPIGMATAVDEQVAAVSSNVESNFRTCLYQAQTFSERLIFRRNSVEIVAFFLIVEIIYTIQVAGNQKKWLFRLSK